MNNNESCSLPLAVSVSCMCTLLNWRQIPPLLEEFGATAIRILLGVPLCQLDWVCQLDLVYTSWKSDSDAAEGSNGL